MIARRRRASPRRSSRSSSAAEISHPRHHNPRRPSFLITRIAMLRLLLLVLCSQAAITLVAATPISYFPLNSQLPPVARVSEPFSFVFSPLTFASETNMSYTLAGGSPPWLSLDGASRRLSGIPDDATVPPGDTLVGVVIGLVASDGIGSTMANATLVVSRAPGPVVKIPFEDQATATRFGPHSAPASVLLHPSTEFRFEFDPYTFGIGIPAGNKDGKTISNSDAMKREDGSNNDGGAGEDGAAPLLNYYAVSGDNAPLPSWISFDSGKLAFAGRTPAFESLVQPPQRFSFKLVASDVVGFSSASVDFSIMVGPHELTVVEPFVELNATLGKELEYTDLSRILKLDGEPLKPENVSSTVAEGLPPWLSFDEKSWKINGTPGTEARPTNITIVVVDKFWDTLNVTLAINFHAKMFIGELPSLNVSAGDKFSFDLKSFLMSPSDTRISTEIPPDNSWIQFDGSTKTLSGMAPRDLMTSDIRIMFKATQVRTNDEEVKDLGIHMKEVPPVPNPKVETKKESNTNRDLYWLMILPIAAVVVGVIFAVFRARRRRYRPKKLDFSEVSGPVPGTFVANGLMDVSSDSISDGSDMRQRSSSIRRSLHTPVPPIDVRASTIVVEQATPHAMTMFSGAIRLTHHGNTARGSWFTGRPSKVSPAVTDEVSLLSDTSLGEDVHISQEDLSPRKLGENMYMKNNGLEVPKIAEPLSIQPTPELAYAKARRYDYVSDDETPPLTSKKKQTSGSQKSAGPNGVWKQGSRSDLSGDGKRGSQNSASTDATTRTSILTSGITEEATASTNVVAKPTVIHIPGRVGETRQLSRRTDDSSTFFGGRSLTRSQRNYGLAKDDMVMPPSAHHQPGESPNPFFAASKEQDVVALSNGSNWQQQQHLARNSLGIPYQDIIQPKRVIGGSFAGPEEKPEIGVAQSQNWNGYQTHGHDNLISPSRWPKLGDRFQPRAGGTNDVFVRSESEPPQLPPFLMPVKSESPLPVMSMSAMENKGKQRRTSFARRSFRGSSSAMVSPLRTPSTHGRNRIRTSREERLRISHIREQKTLNQFRAMLSASTSSQQTPSPSYYKGCPPAPALPGATSRQLPETPSRPPLGRVPLADRSNGSVRGLGLNKNTLSKRSVGTMRSYKSMRSVWGDDDDEDVWEDVRPPESVVGGWEPEASDGNFPVYI